MQLTREKQRLSQHWVAPVRVQCQRIRTSPPRSRKARPLRPLLRGLPHVALGHGAHRDEFLGGRRM
ncbi:MAG: hypothetical protein E6575_14860, partial [Bradyrhizobium sp.]|nr:hypothetical protein [Bradyrhizobium sp.]